MNQSHQGYEFDYQADFTQFLEEARKNTISNQGTLDTQAAGNKQLNGEKKNKKSWKNSLFSWLKSDKNSKSTKQPTTNTVVSQPRRGHFSGPVRGSDGGVTGGRVQKPASGPLTGIFGSTKRVHEDVEVPYLCLSQFNDNYQKSQYYGPVYLVT